MLTPEQLDDVTRRQREMQERFRAVPDSGATIEYLGREFIVYRGVFWPFEDSKPLVAYLREHSAAISGKRVLDVCTGSGVIAVFAAYCGASRVVALDSNPEAVRCAQANTARHGFSEVIDVRLSDMFWALRNGEQFDVITANLPFRDMPAAGLVERTMWDHALETNRKFFAIVGNYLTPDGIVYFSQANFGALSKVMGFAAAAGFQAHLVGENKMSLYDPTDPRVFYAFEMRRSE